MRFDGGVNLLFDFAFSSFNHVPSCKDHVLERNTIFAQERPKMSRLSSENIEKVSCVIRAACLYRGLMFRFASIGLSDFEFPLGSSYKMIEH